MQNNDSRILSLDIAKAICIVLVVVGHYCPENSPAWYQAVNHIIYGFHMPLFMFVSGCVYIASKNDVDYGSFLLKKLKRLIIPYFVTSIIVISIKLLTQSHAYVENPVSIISYLKILIGPEAGYFLWFIWALWWMFVFVPLCKNKKLRLVLFLVAIVLHYIYFPVIELFCFRETKLMLLWFMLGVICFDYAQIRHFVTTYHPVKTMIALLLFCFFAVNNATNLFSVLEYLFPYVGIFFILELSKMIENFIKREKLKVFSVVSGVSYIIYLFHTTFEGFAKAIVHKLPFSSGVCYVFTLEAFAVILIGVIAPVFLYKFVLAKHRITKFLFGIKV